MRKVFVEIGADGYVMAYSSNPTGNPNEIEMQLPEDHVLFSGPPIFCRYVSGEIIKDEQVAEEIFSAVEEAKSRPSLAEENTMLKKQVSDLEDVVLTMMDMAIPV